MEQREEAVQKLLEAQTAQRDLFFVNALTEGVFQSEAQMREAGSRANVEFPHGLFVVIAARTEQWGTVYDPGEQHFILRNALENGFSGPCQAACVLGEMAAILNLEALPALGVRGLVQDANHILTVLEAEFGMEVTMAISRVYGSPMELPRAYLDTQYILEYQSLLGEDYPVTEYEALQHMNIQPANVSYLELEQQILGAARSGDLRRLQEQLHELIYSSFGAAKPTVDTFRIRIYGVVNLLLNLMDELRGTLGNDAINDLNVGERLTQAEKIQDIVREMDDILDALADASGLRKGDSLPDWVPQVQQYIEKNFRDINLTVSSVADAFHMTPTYCSKLYKEAYGTRLLDAICHLRLEEAKRLLTGERNLAEIAEASGFPSVITMGRAFKRLEGLTPGAYREWLRNQSE